MPMFWTFNCFLGCIYTVYFIVHIVFLVLKWLSNLEFRLPRKERKRFFFNWPLPLWMLRKIYAWLLWWKFKSLCFEQSFIKEMPRICSGNGINHEGEQQIHPHQSSTSTETTSKSTKARSAKTTPRTSTKAVSRIFSIWKFSAFSGILWQMVQGKMRNQLW